MTGANFRHLSVMPTEVLELLAPRSGGLYLDGTLGGGGHSFLIMDAVGGDARLLGLDRDPAALARASEVLAPFGDRVMLCHRNFSEMAQVAAEQGLEGFDGILLDLGVSSHQLDAVERGFSFRGDAPLDMRMDPTCGMTAADVLAECPEQELVRIFREYGEERFSGRIARRIVEMRRAAPIQTTGQLAELVRDSVPGGHVPARIHPATRVFQALRIHVNGELDHVASGLEQALGLLRSGGRLAVISFHSLEDRIVKHFFQQQSRDCVCPPRVPICTCNTVPRVRVLTRKGVKAREQEVEANPRSRSAVLRAVELV